jgi:hypothetical protein
MTRIRVKHMTDKHATLSVGHDRDEDGGYMIEHAHLEAARAHGFHVAHLPPAPVPVAPADGDPTSGGATVDGDPTSGGATVDGAVDDGTGQGDSDGAASDTNGKRGKLGKK